jgi:hypothetical protein
MSSAVPRAMRPFRFDRVVSSVECRVALWWLNPIQKGLLSLLLLASKVPWWKIVPERLGLD